MPTITTQDGTEIFFKDQGPRDAKPIVFHHGWPLSSDDWDAQILFFLSKGYRVVAHDRRGHGRSTQTSDGHDMDTYAADAAAVADHLDLHDAVPPVMVLKDSNPGGTPIEVFDGFRAALADNRAQLYLDIPTGPFYGFNRPGAKVSEGLIRNWWRQGMMGSVKAGYECIKAFSETDFTEDLKAIEVPVLVIHSEDDQIVPYSDSGPLAAALLPNGQLKTYKDLPHGCHSTHPELINADLLAFCRGEEVSGVAEPKIEVHIVDAPAIA